MRTRTVVFGVAVMLAGLGPAGAATAVPIDGSDHRANGTTNQSDRGVGICVVGVDSPCNGDRWDGDRSDPIDGGTGDSVDAGTGDPVDTGTADPPMESPGIDLSPVVRLLDSLRFELPIR